MIQIKKGGYTVTTVLSTISSAFKQRKTDEIMLGIEEYKKRTTRIIMNGIKSCAKSHISRSSINCMLCAVYCMISS